MKKWIGVAGVLFLSAGAVAGQDEAREVFAVAASSSLTFMSERVVEDVSQSFLQYTKAGRTGLISEMERVGVLGPAVNKGMSLRTNMTSSTVAVARRVGSNGLDEYDMRGVAVLQWTKCGTSGCVDSGDSKKAVITGVVVSMVLNGRPGYRVSSITLSEGNK